MAVPRCTGKWRRSRQSCLATSTPWKRRRRRKNNRLRQSGLMFSNAGPELTQWAALSSSHHCPEDNGMLAPVTGHRKAIGMASQAVEHQYGTGLSRDGWLHRPKEAAYPALSETLSGLQIMRSGNVRRGASAAAGGALFRNSRSPEQSCGCQIGPPGCGAVPAPR
jgi:hypothetical protein